MRIYKSRRTQSEFNDERIETSEFKVDMSFTMPLVVTVVLGMGGREVSIYLSVCLSVCLSILFIYLFID